MSQKEQQKKEKEFDFISEEVEEIYVDGVSNIILGIPVTKVLFHLLDQAATENKLEVRRGILNLTIPTITLIEFCANFLNGLVLNKDGVSSTLQQHNKKFMEIVDALEKSQKLAQQDQEQK